MEGQLIIALGILLIFGSLYLDDLDSQENLIMLHGKKYRMDEPTKHEMISLLMWGLGHACFILEIFRLWKH